MPHLLICARNAEELAKTLQNKGYNLHIATTVEQAFAHQTEANRTGMTFQGYIFGPATLAEKSATLAAMIHATRSLSLTHINDCNLPVAPVLTSHTENVTAENVHVLKSVDTESILHALKLFV